MMLCQLWIRIYAISKSGQLGEQLTYVKIEEGSHPLCFSDLQSCAKPNKTYTSLVVMYGVT